MFLTWRREQLGHDYTPPQIINSVLLSRERKVELLTGLRAEVAGTWYTRDGVVFSLDEIDSALAELQQPADTRRHSGTHEFGMIGQ